MLLKNNITSGGASNQWMEIALFIFLVLYSTYRRLCNYIHNDRRFADATVYEESLDTMASSSSLMVNSPNHVRTIS